MKVLVIGASENPQRISNQAIAMLQEYGHDPLAIGRDKGQTHGISIRDHEILSDDIHTVTLYINPTVQPAYYDYIVSLQPKRVIFNPGTENPDFYSLLEKADIGYEAACTLVLLRTEQF